MGHRDIDEAQRAFTRRDRQEVLGGYIAGSDLLGDDPNKGFSTQFAVNAAAELANRGIDEYTSRKAATEAAHEVDAKSAAIIALDADATQKCADAAIALKMAKGNASDPAVRAKQSAAEQAQAAQDQGGAGLSAAVTARRVAAAQAAAKSANDAWSADPKNLYKEVKATCARATLVKAQAGAPASSGGGALAPLPPPPSEGFSLSKVYGGVPAWGWGVGGIAVGGGLIALIVKLTRRK